MDDSDLLNEFVDEAKEHLGSVDAQLLHIEALGADRRRFFHQKDGGWKVNDELRGLVRYQVGNLLSGVQPTGPFDIIFCRNVIIYFSGDAPKRTYRMLSSRLAKTGRLFVGCSEVLTDTDQYLKRERIRNVTCYVPARQTEARQKQ
ncbi:Chemotaxis protein methyltransferase Cher2 [Novipirellula aureliae]|uniref:Chemotaxis protein methyltransferase Cher2 n=1 Tax=Novipirellula aureliae TaxID=2527966 RepID=A0A5C6DUY9_9BACT|nr:CheR family methyltransferase [Novipirellula aureliae]TWU40145.1 Chemotaxis protein methyltransferase Cher2 [Novipirellula aureliae]